MPGSATTPVVAQIERTSWQTSLFPKDDRYLVPVKKSVRTAEGLELGDVVTVRLSIDGG